MKKVNLLSRAEMKGIQGGVMDRDTTLQYCIDHLSDNPSDDAEAEELGIQIGTQLCWDAYDRMTF